MRLFDICRGADLKCPPDLENIEIEGISSSSYDIKKNFIFVCLRGNATDGHLYINDALGRGAAAVVIEDPSFVGEKTILTSDTRVALAKMADSLCEHPAQKLRMIGVTGTNGKTSVTAMIKNIFDRAHQSCEMLGTLSGITKGNACFTTPDPELLYPKLKEICDSGIKTVVMEASSHALKFKKLEPIIFDIGIFTGLTEDHLDFHGNMEDYFKSKIELFKHSRLGIINVDDGFGKRIAEDPPCKIKTCSLLGHADYFVKDLEYLGSRGSEFTACSEHGDIRIKCAIPGDFSVMNALEACAAAIESGISGESIETAFEAFCGVEGRFERIELPGGTDIEVIIDYAHTPDALKKTLGVINKIKSKGSRTIVLFGCGGEREKEKRSLMGKIAVCEADLAIITSDNSRSEPTNEILRDILLGVGENYNYAVIPDRRQAIEYAIASADQGDILLLAGKGHEKYEINRSGKLPFDERKVVREACEKYKLGGK